MIRKGSAPEGHDDLSATAVNLPSSDLHDLPDRHRLIAPDVENPFQDEVCVQSGSAERGRVSSFKRQCQQGTRVEGSVVVGIAWQDQAMAQGLCILGLRLSHARRVPRIVSEVKRWSIRENLSCRKPGRNRTVECGCGAASLACWPWAERFHTRIMSAKKHPHLVGVRWISKQLRR
jgi:hypothetical protein